VLDNFMDRGNRIGEIYSPKVKRVRVYYDACIIR